MFRPGQAVFAKLSQLVQSALDGYNVCIFTYGKTFTLIPMTIQQIFLVQEKLKAKSWVYKLQASFWRSITRRSATWPRKTQYFPLNSTIVYQYFKLEGAPLLAEGRWQ